MTRSVSQAELQEIIRLHGMWLRGEECGVCANLRYANLSRANLSDANLSYANLSDAYLSYANLSYADLSGCIGVLDPINWLSEHLEATPDGYVAYKAFGTQYSPASWEIRPGAVLSEVVNPLPTSDCACGINVATRTWPELPKSGVWRVLIRWAWLPSVVVPYTTTGKFRCGRCELIEEVTE